MRVKSTTRLDRACLEQSLRRWSSQAVGGRAVGTLGGFARARDRGAASERLRGLPIRFTSQIWTVGLAVVSLVS